MDEQEKKELLIALCGYLPYGIVCDRPSGNSVITKIYFDKEYNDWVAYNEEGLGGSITFEKPYLRPMSSMTDDEKKELCELAEVETIGIDDRWGSCLSWNIGTSDDYIDVSFEIDAIAKASAWLNEKKFDWRRVKVNGKYVSFIKAGLALEAPADMYK